MIQRNLDQKKKIPSDGKDITKGYDLRAEISGIIASVENLNYRQLSFNSNVNSLKFKC